MSNTKWLRSLSGLMVAALALPLFANAAALIDIGVGTYGSKLNLNTEVKADVDLDTSIDADSNSSVQGVSSQFSQAAAIKASLDAGQTLRINKESIRANTETGVNINANLGAGSNASTTGAPTNATSSSRANANALANASVRSSITDPAQVRTAADLESFASARLMSDEKIREIVFTSDSVEIDYRQNGRILGLFPTTFVSRIVAKADGSVEIKYPWYVFSADVDKAELEAEVKTTLEEARANSQGAFHANEQALLAANIHSVLQVETSTDDEDDEN